MSASSRNRSSDEGAGRLYPMNRPEGHAPVIQRYSSDVPEPIASVQVLVLGVQVAGSPLSGDPANDAVTTSAALEQTFGSHLRGADGPEHLDYASVRDPEGHQNGFCMAYWHDLERADRWFQAFENGWQAIDAGGLSTGLWLESFVVPITHRETIAFQEYIRGLSACPAASLVTTEESGYWGAARDRIPASANDRFSVDPAAALTNGATRQTVGRRVAIAAPQNMAVIRSGVSWLDCGEVQRASYFENLKPKLDAGMEFLRTEPARTGCCSLRQAECVAADGGPTSEQFSLGYFLSLGHLEQWSKHHPTHLAIYGQALAERKKYQDDLELRTYHEVYILQDGGRFEYLNCHPATGLLPHFAEA